MDAKITFSIVSESLAGNIGDDWQYRVTAKVFNPTLLSVGTVAVDRHQLTPGTTATPPGGSQTVSLRGGACGSAARVELSVQATEVDWLFDDDGSNRVMVDLECPAEGDSPNVIEPEINVHVRESPRILGGAAKLTIRVRLAASCI